MFAWRKGSPKRVAMPKPWRKRGFPIVEAVRIEAGQGPAADPLQPPDLETHRLRPGCGPHSETSPLACTPKEAIPCPTLMHAAAGFEIGRRRGCSAVQKLEGRFSPPRSSGVFRLSGVGISSTIPGTSRICETRGRQWKVRARNRLFSAGSGRLDSQPAISPGRCGIPIREGVIEERAALWIGPAAALNRRHVCVATH